MGATVLAMSSPASAYPNWQSVSPDSHWHCGRTTQHPDSTNVYMQTCIIVNDNRDAQAVTVVQNKSNVAIHLAALATASFGGSAKCNDTAIRPGRQVGCFSRTVHVRSGQDLKAWSFVRMNGNEPAATTRAARYHI
ncbi:hypothetical protein ACIBHX_20310 [Nonomuraea sp. NPDC050536]|uniref:hypothetical protein n=1 Tax=Nonomuraea sp. NPDC050536 TaxID=3364366 RepID=UPI0037C6142A